MSTAMVTIGRHCTPKVAAEALNKLGESFESGKPIGVIINMLGMPGYDTSSSQVFVSWANANKHFIRRIAIVTDNPTWHIIVSTMTSDIEVEICSFYNCDDAEKWLRSAN